MRTCGHTMGTPKMDAFEAMEFFASVGHDGIEFRCAADGQIDPDAYTPALGGRLRAKADALGIEIACLTPYYKNYVDPAKRESEMQGMRHMVDIAADLGCTRLRSYGGPMPTQAFDHDVTWTRTAEGIREVADYAAAKRVTICIETHIGSLTLTAAETVKMAQAVDRPNVGILFDYAWIHYAAEEQAEAAVELCAPFLRHCHVKDWSYTDDDREQRHSELMGEGDVDWPVALAVLKRSGYDGYMSDEYEKYWYDHLPEPQVGMKHNREYVATHWAEA